MFQYEQSESGVGMAEHTLASRLEKFGFSPTIVEKRLGLGDEGYIIDFYDSGLDVAERTGLPEVLRARQYLLSKLVLVDQQSIFRVLKGAGLGILAMSVAPPADPSDALVALFSEYKPTLVT